jgi:serine phosphatase RsbU (regulator of sigma subunit)
MTRQEILLVISDGVTEAMNPEGELYGARRLLQAIGSARHADSPATFVSAVRADVAKFVAGSEAADDLTLLAMRWNGPPSSER